MMDLSGLMIFGFYSERTDFLAFPVGGGKAPAVLAVFVDFGIVKTIVIRFGLNICLALFSIYIYIYIYIYVCVYIMHMYITI